MTRRPIQTLGVVPRLFPLIASGDKTSTIRWRETRIAPGYMRYVCDGEPEKTVTVWVTRCTDMPLSEAAAVVGKAEKWPKDIMLAGMREHYPAIRWEDTVQVVEHLTPEVTSRRGDFTEAL